MLLNARVTAFTISELLRENQQGGGIKLPSPTQIRVNYEIKTDNVYEDFYEDKYFFDFSNYSKNSKFFDPSSLNKIGKMEDESERKINDELAGLKSKMCSLTNVDCEENKTEKMSQ